MKRTDQPSPNGFLSQAGLAALAARSPTQQVLVRMEGCRFTAPAAQAAYIIEHLEAAGEYCRDVTTRFSIGAYSFPPVTENPS